MSNTRPGGRLDATKAGWYPTPESPYWVRWWTGTKWANAYWQVRNAPSEYLASARRFGVSSPGHPTYDVVGEAYREHEIAAAIGRTLQRDHEIEWFGVAELVPEPNNPHRPQGDAISVRIGGHVVGYLPNEDVSAYAPAIHRFVDAGVVPTVRARVWAVTRYVAPRGRDELKSAIRLSLPAPDQLVPRNTTPAVPNVLIPPGRRIQVTGEESHMDVLAPYVSQRDRDQVLVTLHTIEIPRVRSTSRVIEVRLDGHRLGQLSPTTSASLEPLLREAEQANRVAVAWARITGSRLAAEVTLDVARPTDIPNAWPASGDEYPDLSTGGRGLPASYVGQRKIGPPPEATGLSMWLIIAGVLALLALSTVPYIGILLMIAGGAGLIWWAIVAGRRPPRNAPAQIT